MRLTIILATLCTLTACATHPMQNNPDFRACQLQAKLHTPGTNNVFTDVFREHELIQLCMANKGYTTTR